MTVSASAVDAAMLPFQGLKRDLLGLADGGFRPPALAETGSDEAGFKLEHESPPLIYFSIFKILSKNQDA